MQPLWWQSIINGGVSVPPSSLGFLCLTVSCTAHFFIDRVALSMTCTVTKICYETWHAELISTLFDTGMQTKFFRGTLSSAYGWKSKMAACYCITQNAMEGSYSIMKGFFLFVWVFLVCHMWKKTGQLFLNTKVVFLTTQLPDTDSILWCSGAVKWLEHLLGNS